MTHRDAEEHHSARWRWALAVAAVGLIVWALYELRDMQQRVQYLERQAEGLYWRLGDKHVQEIPREDHDGRDP